MSNGGGKPRDGGVFLYDVMFNHNWYRNGNAIRGLACTPRPHFFCGGYQPWMDYFLPRSWRVVMISEPMGRVASMFYYEHEFGASLLATESKIAFAEHNISINTSSVESRSKIRAFLQGYGHTRWGRVQWHWLCEGTPQHDLESVIKMLRNNAFLVGITQYFDHSLLLYRHFMGLLIEDVVYFRLKASISHPKLTDWHPEDQHLAHQVVKDSGDDRFYSVAMEVFEAQVDVYGGWAKLSAEVAAFQSINAELERLCANVKVLSDDVGLYKKGVCFLAQYRRNSLGAPYFNEI